MSNKGNNHRILNCLSLIYVFMLLGFQLESKAQSDEPVHFLHYTTEDGLPSSYVKSIVQDADGFIWSATRSANVRFDGKAFREFPAFDSEHVPVKIFCNKLFMTRDSILIARTNNEKYYYFDSDKECFFPHPLLTALGPTTAILPTTNGFWVCQNNELFFLDQHSGQRESLRQKFKLHQLPDQIQFTGVYEQGDWLAFSTNAATIYAYSHSRQKLNRYDLPGELNPIQHDLRLIDSHGNLWISSLDFGVARLHMESGKSHFYAKERKNQYHIPHNLVHCFTEDQRGRVWIGTESGLAIYNGETDLLNLHNYKLSEPNGLNTDPIYDAFCDKQGNVWLGTYFGGINFWRGEKQFFRTWAPGYGTWQITGNVVSCLAEDQDKNLWIGLEDKGLNKLDIQTGEITHYASEDGPNNLSYNNLHDLLFVNDHELWIGTYTGGINILNTKTNRFSHYNKKNTPIQISNSIYQFFQVNSSIYVATTEGIIVFDKQNKTFRKLKPDIIGDIQFECISSINDLLWFSSAAQIFQYDPKNDSLYTFDLVPEMRNINFVKADSDNRIWIGDCYKGLCCYNPEQGTVKHFNPENGFPAHWIFSLEEGKDGWFWVSTDKGLIRFSPGHNRYTLFDSNSGIPFNQFNYRASFTDSNGNIYFGGNNGMISFNEDAESTDLQKLPIVFTGIQLFNKPLRPGDIKSLDRSINKLDKLVLKYNQNVFTIEFTAFCYSSGGRCQYAYFLEGFETEWNTVGNRNFATYTNLNPGTYTFRVKGSMGDNQNESEERQLTVIVRPPFWLTNWAFALYFVLAVLIFILVFRVGKNLEKSKALAELEHREKVHADEIHKVKLEFFTNISHELKTPLTLILGPLKKIIEEEKLSPAFRRQLVGIERNANRLFQLINQLLEFRKIENGKENLKVSPCELRPLMEEISNSFENVVDSRDIDFQLDFPQAGKIVWMDVDKVDKIIFNLLSNAFKFTPEGGRIRFSVELKRRANRSSQELVDLIVRVSDSGKGITPEMLEKVFDRFFQIEDGQRHNNGSGIGLAFVKNLVILHRGNITVESIVNKGTSFTVCLPASKEDFNQTEISTQPAQYEPCREVPEMQLIHQGKSELVNPDVFSSKPTILIVEDNLELISFMKETLELKYQIVTALNGMKALEKLESVTPDLIISDIMMPDLDGLELTQRLKSDLRVSHIPIILLTSQSGEDSKLGGLRSGADYYIEKPFFPKILDQNIENILNTRKRLIERFKSDDSLQIEKMAHSESDKIFIEKLTAIIKENISNPDLDVTLLKQAMGVSRSLLHLKLKGLVGCSSTEFIRAIRLKEAVKLISCGKCNISEAAYETGFSSPTYFTRRFREFYGKSPREYFTL